MNLPSAIFSLRPGAQWVLDGDTYEGIQWLDETQTKPSEDEIAQEIARLRAEHERTQYQRQRAPEYPSITDQLDALFHAGVFPPEMAAQIQAIKDKYPKPE
jgi:hypothetical protein